jgi:preprotein translocase subunit SecF
MRLFTNTNIQFVKVRYIAYIISAIILLVGLVGLIANGLNWSIDFTSGVAAKVNLKALDSSVSPLRIDELRSVLRTNGFPEAEIQHVGEIEDASFMIKIKSPDSESDVSSETKNIIIDIIKTSFPAYVEGKDINRDVIEEIYEVGPKVGGELRTQAMMAVIIALVLIVIYVWFRFELTFGFMAIVALFHDVLCILGIFALTGREITIQIIAVMLTIVGYSINDTIVVFDRIREDLKANRKESYENVFNSSMNKTLSRTIITSGTTLLTALALYFFGGSVLRDFAFAMTLGILFGTYSSIFVASNLVVDWYHISHKEKKSIQHLTKRK